MKESGMKFILEEIAPESGAGKAEAYLADYWICRNALLEKYGKTHFFDLDRVLPGKARRKLKYLMNRYIREVKKEECGAA